MHRTWQIQTAKARFSELVQRAKNDGPQLITFRGIDTAVMLSIDDYHRLEGARPSLKDALVSGPTFADEDIERLNERSRDQGRDVGL